MAALCCSLVLHQFSSWYYHKDRNEDDEDDEDGDDDEWYEMLHSQKTKANNPINLVLL